MQGKRSCYAALIITLLFTGNAAASDLNKGREIYERHCIVCHGRSGQSTMAGAPDFNRGEGLFQSDQGLLARIQSGNNACPAYRGILSEQKIFDVIAYIRSFQ